MSHFHVNKNESFPQMEASLILDYNPGIFQVNDGAWPWNQTPTDSNPISDAALMASFDSNYQLGPGYTGSAPTLVGYSAKPRYVNTMDHVDERYYQMISGCPPTESTQYVDMAVAKGMEHATPAFPPSAFQHMPEPLQQYDYSTDLSSNTFEYFSDPFLDSLEAIQPSIEQAAGGCDPASIDDNGRPTDFGCDWQPPSTPQSRDVSVASQDNDPPGARDDSSQPPDLHDLAPDRDEPYAQLIFRALLSAPNHQMILREIYEWFRNNTDKAHDPQSTGWQNSIRHNLSMNGAFTKIDIPGDDDAKKGFIWQLTDEAIREGVKSTTRFRPKQPLKRGRHVLRPKQPQRQASGAKGGQAARKSQRLRRSERLRQDGSSRINPEPSAGLTRQQQLHDGITSYATDPLFFQSSGMATGRHGNSSSPSGAVGTFGHSSLSSRLQHDIHSTHRGSPGPYYTDYYGNGALPSIPENRPYPLSSQAVTAGTSDQAVKIEHTNDIYATASPSPPNHWSHLMKHDPNNPLFSFQSTGLAFDNTPGCTPNGTPDGTPEPKTPGIIGNTMVSDFEDLTNDEYHTMGIHYDMH